MKCLLSLAALLACVALPWSASADKAQLSGLWQDRA